MAADLKKLLAYHRQLGIDSYPVPGDLALACRKERERPPVKPFMKKKVPSQKMEKALVENTERTESLSDIFYQVDECSRCAAGMHVKRKAPEIAPEKIRLMIVGDYCIEKDAGGVSCLFGKEEDVMLGRMIQALGLSMEEVYVTNCIKCFCKPEALPGQTYSDQCTSFIAREIAAVRPPVICAMGELSARILLGVNTPLIRLRGSFHPYRWFEQYPVEVMPTFHPRFLLEHEEMKRATWNDLQQIRKRFLES